MPKGTAMIESFLQPWRESLADPGRAQEATLRRLLRRYVQTEYGAAHGAEEVSSIEEYRRAFPVVTYADLRPVLERVMRGHWRAFLAEPPLAWAMTRGTTGQSKFIPMTKADLDERTLCGPRGLLCYVSRTGRYDILEGYDLNLNFPSVIGSMAAEGREVPYGYSSGIYAKYNAERARLKIVPAQEEIDALGGGTTEEDWERRFELAYERARDKNITMVIGVTQVMIRFGQFMKRRYGIYPKDIWKIGVLIPTSIAGIQTKYRPALRGLYGDAAIVEMYGATEGLFAQQMDEKPFVVPNYDVYFLEVETGRGVRMLHELERGEHGSLVVSTPTLPRYRIGDVVMAFGGHYFRCIGRERPFAFLRYLAEGLLNGDWEGIWPGILRLPKSSRLRKSGSFT